MSEISLGDGSVIEVERDFETQFIKVKFRTRHEDRSVSAMMATLETGQRDALVQALREA